MLTASSAIRSLAALLVALLLVACARSSVADLTVRLLSPASGSYLPTGQVIEFDSLTDGPGRVTRVELYVNGDLIADDAVPTGMAQPSFRVRQRWVPTEPGRAEVLVYAYDAKGTQSRPAAILLEIVGEALVEVPTATAAPPTPRLPTAPPAPTEPPTATPTPEPTEGAAVELPGTIIAAAGANIRDGPSPDAARIDGLYAGAAVTAIGRNDAGDWIKIRYGADNRIGWVVTSLGEWDGDIALLPAE